MIMQGLPTASPKPPELPLKMARMDNFTAPQQNKSA
jgi:hypothetical protein